MATWISMAEACRLLGVQQQTVYAYASRGKVEAMTDPGDSRKSLYRAEDVQQLARRKQAGRKRETLVTQALSGVEPSIPTALSTFHRGRLLFRGQDAVELARSASLEDLAGLLWATQGPVDFQVPGPAPVEKGRVAAFTLLGGLAATGLATSGRTPRVLHEEGQKLVGHLANALGAQGPRRALHLRLAKGWQQGPAAAELLRAAMVLTVDHELTSSAFATRIAASTGASLPASLLAGLCTFSGPRHGDASGQIRTLLAEVKQYGADQVVERHLLAGVALPGFGHHLYPEGDPRARALLDLWTPASPTTRFIERGTALTGLAPNIDLAIAALVEYLDLPIDSGFCLIALSRSIGLLAHCFEQLEIRQTFRPRGRYIGSIPRS